MKKTHQSRSLFLCVYTCSVRAGIRSFHQEENYEISTSLMIIRCWKELEDSQLQWEIYKNMEFFCVVFVVSAGSPWELEILSSSQHLCSCFFVCSLSFISHLSSSSRLYGSLLLLSATRRKYEHDKDNFRLRKDEEEAKGRQWNECRVMSMSSSSSFVHVCCALEEMSSSVFLISTSLKDALTAIFIRFSSNFPTVVLPILDVFVFWEISLFH